MSTPCKYRPLGTKVVVKILPIENKSEILLPDGKTNPRERQTFEVVAVGGEVNDSTFSLSVGEVVLIAAHASDFLPLCEENQWALVDRSRIICAVDKNVLN